MHEDTIFTLSVCAMKVDWMRASEPVTLALAQMQTLVQLHARLLELWPDLSTPSGAGIWADRDRNGVITSDEWIKVSDVH